MLTQVVLQTLNPMTLNIESADPDEILIVKSISGLTSQGNTLYTGDFAQGGSYYQGRRTNKLNPVMTFKLNPNYTDDIDVSDIRDMLYRMFYEPQPDSDGVQVLLKDDRRPDRYFIGYSEDINTDMWSKTQEAAVSMVCMDTHLQSAVPVEFSDPGGLISTPIDYEGSADVGFEIDLKVTAAETDITVSNNGADMILKGSFATNDVITINTALGNRYIRVNDVDALVILQADSKWLQLTQADNTLSVSGDAVITGYSYRAAWWGL